MPSSLQRSAALSPRCPRRTHEGECRHLCASHRTTRGAAVKGGQARSARALHRISGHHQRGQLRPRALNHRRSPFQLAAPTWRRAGLSRFRHRCRADGSAGFRRRGLAASCPLAIPSDQPDAWEVHAFRPSILLPRPTRPALRANRHRSCRARLSDALRGLPPHSPASWLPCQPDACASRRRLTSRSPTPGYVPGNSCCAFGLRLRLPFVLPIRESRRRSLRIARLPPPPSTFMSAAVYRAS